MRGCARSLAVVVGLACGAASLSACVPVPAWSRGRLAHPAMADPAQAECAGFDGHLAGARESALEPSAAGGGGCGCN